MASEKGAKDALAALGAWQEAICGHAQRRRVPTPIGEDTRTKQSMAEATDATAIMRKYLSTGEIPEYRKGTYGDFSSGDDYHAMLQKVQAAEDAFLALPPEVRQAARNDPGRLLDLVSDPALKEEAVALGLLPGEPEDPKKVAEAKAAPAEEE